jgi:hypothetical protein
MHTIHYNKSFTDCFTKYCYPIIYVVAKLIRIENIWIILGPEIFQFVKYETHCNNTNFGVFYILSNSLLIHPLPY